MKTPRILLLLCLFWVNTPFVSAQRLQPFLAATGGITTNGKKDPVPYPKVTGLFDFLSPGEKPDSNSNGAAWYFVYLEIPGGATEIGVRMMSPVPENYYAFPGDLVTASYEQNSKSRNWFDPALMLEQYLPDPIDSSGVHQAGKWVLLGSNNRSDETPLLPDGTAGNALVRMFSGPYETGIYRIRFRSESKKTEGGTYLIQVGTQPGLRGVQMYRKKDQ